MRKRVYYEAIDGVQFDTVQACEDYENKLQDCVRDIIFLDEDFERMPVTKENMSIVEVIVVNSDAALEWFNNITERVNIDSQGIWVKEEASTDGFIFYDLEHSVEELYRGYELERRYLEDVLKAIHEI